ncbi:hypothetical protein GCM10010129_75810 [Streptomyces fumigatiscleroticus]|nr:hypothetical protein GCM10010129_75810 [Streptomyces fumigatiscleroticus]
MSGSRSETVEDTVCGRCAAMEPTEGCACWTCAWVFGWLMDPFFRARGDTGASDNAGGSVAARRVSPSPALPPRDGGGSGTAGFIQRASQGSLNRWLRRHDVRDSGGRIAGVYSTGRMTATARADGHRTGGHRTGGHHTGGHHTGGHRTARGG